jgi:predicted DNA-binding transcriptional regulator YafY
LITYRNQAGNRTVREIQPRRLYGKWLDSWCHLRDAQREFTVANIESVAPAG